MAKKDSEKFFDLDSEWEVVNVRSFDFGTFFTLKMPGLALYNLRVVPEGKNYNAFIGMPEEKGKDGGYHKVYALYLSDRDTKAVLDAVDAALEDKAHKRK